MAKGRATVQARLVTRTNQRAAQVATRPASDQHSGDRRGGGAVFLAGLAAYTSRLRQHLKRPARRPWSGEAQSIHQRAKDVQSRIQKGHWEADTAVGKKKDAQRILMINERQSLYMELVLQRHPDAATTSASMKRRLGKNGIAFRSVTTDRGSEFTATGRVFKDKAFVCDPHAPNQRGANENQIGMMRVDLPKGMSMDHLTPANVKALQNKYNHRPRKSLGFLTPYEVAFNRRPRVGTRT